MVVQALIYVNLLWNEIEPRSFGSHINDGYDIYMLRYVIALSPCW